MIETQKLLSMEDPIKVVEYLFGLERAMKPNKQTMQFVVVYCTGGRSYVGIQLSLGADHIGRGNFYLTKLPSWGLFLTREEIELVEVYTITAKGGEGDE